jgi:DNA-binding transcriptional MerR regulator
LHLKLALSQVPSTRIPIGELARRAGLRPSAVRYYEAVGLLPEPERTAGKRRYDERIVQRLSVIAAGKHAGLSLDEIRELFIADERGAVSSRLQQLSLRKLPEIEDLITRAEAVRSWLQAAAECECPSLDQCPLFDARS